MVAPAVFEVTMAAPDIVCVEVRDPNIVRGDLTGPLSISDAAAYNTFVQRTNPNTGLTDWCRVVSQDKKWLRFQDQRATAYLDRPAADDAASYGQIGGRTVTAVYRKSIPYVTGTCRGSAGSPAGAVSMKHFLFLVLNGNLAAGSHTISFPSGTGLGSVAFNYSAMTTRASSIHASQVGHRPGDVSKIAYWSLWMPGAPNEGAIDLSTYGLTTFDVINASGEIKFTGAIAARVGPTDVEPSSGSLIRYASTTNAPKVLTAITKANPGAVTCAGHGFSNGEFKMLRGIGGMTQLESLTVKVANLTTDTFELQDSSGVNLNTSSFGTYAAGTYISGFDSLIYNTYLANSSCTYVYGLDYSSFIPDEPGLYRISIPGFAVSDEIRFDEAVWYQVAKNSASGMYHQASGVELDGRFGYTRPACFRDGLNGIEIYHTTIPASFASELQAAAPSISSALGDSSTWITGTRATGIYGAFMDAGDWDTFLDEHAKWMWNLLDLGYEKLDAASRETSFGFPKASELCDEATYSDIDVLPDVIHMGVFYADMFRRLQAQRGDGAVPGGMGFSQNGITETGSGPSWLPVAGDNNITAYIYAPDHAGTFSYVIVAAKLAKIFSDLGYTTLASLYQDSAIDAWDWAESIYQSQLTDGIVRDAYYITELDIRTKAGWSAGTYTSAMSSLQTAATDRRRAAAGSLFRLTGDSTYGDIITPLIGQPLSGWMNVCAWEFVYSVGGNAATKADFATRFATAGNSIKTYSNSDVSYRNNGTSGSSGIGTGGQSPAELVIRSYITTGNSTWLDVLQAGRGYVLGANQLGRSFTTGLGVRQIVETLHEDSRRMGLSGPPIGITHYGFDTPSINFRPFNFTTDVAVNFIVETPTGAFEADFGTAKISEPYRLSMPFREQNVESSLIIFHMEYTWEQTIAPQLMIALWLHGWDGNTQTEFVEEPEPTAITPVGRPTRRYHDPDIFEKQPRPFSRRYFNELKAAEAAQRAAQERANRLKSRQAKQALNRAAQEAAEAIAHAKETEVELARMTAALEAARSASDLAETIRQADLAIQYAREIQEEDEAIALLMLH